MEVTLRKVEIDGGLLSDRDDLTGQGYPSRGESGARKTDPSVASGHPVPRAELRRSVGTRLDQQTRSKSSGAHTPALWRLLDIHHR